MTKNKSGFTIVELLIVIVVIAILAAIALVSYTNIQQRARNTSVISSVSGWMNVLKASYAANGSVEVTVPSGDNSICLGAKEQYPAVSAELEEGQCYVYAHTSDQLEDAMGDFANISMTTYVTDNGEYPFRGIQYYNGADDTTTIWYSLYGAGQDCGLPGSSSYGGSDTSTECAIDVTAAVGGIPINFGN